MIEMPLFNEEKWYLQEVKNAMTDRRCKNEKMINKMYEEECKKLSFLLSDILTEDDFGPQHQEKTLFEKLVLGTYEELQNIYERINGIADDIFFDKEVDSKGMLKKKIKDKWNSIYHLYDKLIRNDFNIKLIHKYDIKSCPYCNENYIINRRKKKGKKYATAQIDHFIPRDIIPVFQYHFTI